VWSRCTWMGYGTFGGQLFFYIYFWTPQKSTAATATAYINTVMFFFCLASLLCLSTNRCNEYLTNISFFPFKYLYRNRAARSPLSSSFPFFFFFYISLFYPYVYVWCCTVISNSYNNNLRMHAYNIVRGTRTKIYIYTLISKLY